MMTLVVLLTPGGMRQSLGFILQNEEAQLSDVTDWQNVQVAGGAARLQLPQVLQQRDGRWVLPGKDVSFSTAYIDTGAGWSAKQMLPAYERLLDESPASLSGLEGTIYTLERNGHLEQHAVIVSPDAQHALEVSVTAPDMGTLQGLEPTFGTVLRSARFAP